ncbi:cytochrome P450 [Streptomyces sp. NEAU-sy36]|uniref:cytochrome P450 n=1 Tax=unclassified Streptomyces TaxID=2593676 RepID=UPI0015D63F5D|nr:MULTISPECIES: cytochrome P450 [unclassified Streptomyces]QLJ02496.1 cytochrome P450 [Streptomyces sp. NEAU-sy36]
MTAAARPAPPPVARGRLPLIGHGLHMWRRPLEFLDTLTAYDPIVAVHLGPKPAYVLTSPDLVHRVMVSDAADYAKGRSFEKLRDYLGNGLATSEGSFHLRQRRLMQPAFHHTHIARHARTMAQTATARAASWRPGQAIDVTREMYDLSLAVLASTLFSTTLDERLAAEIRHTVPLVLRGMYTRVLDPTNLWQRLPTPGNRRLADAHRRLRNVIDHLIDARRGSPPDGEPDLLTLLLRAEDASTADTMTSQQVYDEVVTLLVAGTETVAGGLAWLFHELGLHPDADRELYEEVRQQSGAPFDLDRLDQLPRTRRTVDEALRVPNPGGVTIRRAVTDVELGGHHFKRGTEFVFSALVLHRNPRHFPDPTRFDPDRWLPDRPAAPRGAFIPFGAGSHQCIGESFARAEMTATVVAVVNQWRLEPVPGRRVRGVMTSTNHPRDLVMTARPRTAAARP